MTKSEYEVLAGFRYAIRQFQRFSEAAVSVHGVTPKQHQAMLAIQGFPGRDYVTVGELAERLQILHHSAVGLVDRLVAQGLAERRTDEDDRRHVHVRLTPHGLNTLEQLSAVNREELRRLRPYFERLLAHLGSAHEQS